MGQTRYDRLPFMNETDVAVSDRNNPDNFETTLQPDPIMIILIVTFVGLVSRNRNTSQNEASSNVSEPSPPSGVSKPALAAQSTDRTTSLAPRADENTSTKQ